VPGFKLIHLLAQNDPPGFIGINTIRRIFAYGKVVEPMTTQETEYHRMRLIPPSR